jgi:hypothetical protein
VQTTTRAPKVIRENVSLTHSCTQTALTIARFTEQWVAHFKIKESKVGTDEDFEECSSPLAHTACILYFNLLYIV